MVVMNAFVIPYWKTSVKVTRKYGLKRKCLHFKVITSSNANDSFSWEGWKLSHLFRQFLRKTGHFPLHGRKSYIFPHPDSVLKLPPAKSTPEQELQKLSDELRFKYNFELTKQSSSTEKQQQQLVSVSGTNATLYGQLIQYSQDKSKVWIRPLLLMEEEIDTIQMKATGTVHKNYYSLVSAQDLLLPAKLVMPYDNGLTSLLNILHETVTEKVDIVLQREKASQVLFRFLQSFQQ